MNVRLSQRYRFWMWLLLPLTLGVGTLALWLYALRWPLRLEKNGILLRNGLFVRWGDITRLGVVEREFEQEAIRLDLFFKGGVARVPVQYLDHGERVAATIRASFHGPRRNVGQPVR